MKASFAWGGTAFLAFVALVLWLNLRERDHYELGSLTPVDGTPEAAFDLERLLPAAVKHGDCEHGLEVVEQRRTLRLRDRDGWHRLFWAGDEIYHYKEIVHLAGDLQNATAVGPDGRWEIAVRAAAAPCGTSPGEARVVYELRAAEGSFDAGPPGPLGLPSVSPAMAYRCAAEHLPPVLHFAWVLAK